MTGLFTGGWDSASGVALFTRGWVLPVEAGGGSGAARREAWSDIRRAPNIIAVMRRAAQAAQEQAEAAEQPLPAEDVLEAIVKAPGPVVAKTSPTSAQIARFVGAIQRELEPEVLADIPLAPDDLARDFLTGEWLLPADIEAKRRDDDAMAILLLSM